MSKKKTDDADEAGGEPRDAEKGASRFRTALPQVLASTAKNLILLDLGMTVAFPTVIIPALHHVAGDLMLDDTQASWLGSLAFICQPVGSILSGLVLEPLGRKRSMILVNLPQLVGWLMLYWADSVYMLYAASVVMGLGVGFMEAPIITYVGEISQPELRGVLTSYSGIFAQLGFVLEYLLGTVTSWRNAAAISAIVPIVTALAITQVPETPMWLLSRGRKEEAEASLCWLRGWVQPAAVQKEFQELVHYHETSRHKRQLRKASRVSEILTPEEEARFRAAAVLERHRGSQNWPVPVFPGKPEPEPTPELLLVADEEGCCGPETACSRRIKDLFSSHTLRPLLLVVTLFFFQHAAGMSGLRPYMVEVVREFGMPIDAHWGTVVSGLIGLVGSVLCMVLVPWCGKRPLTLVSLAGCAMSALLLGGYAYALLSADVGTRLVGTWAPLALFIALSFCHSFGIGPIPWMMLSEVFPFRTRGLGSGVAAAISYVLGFIASKTFLWLQTNLGRSGVFWLYGCFSTLGLALLAWKMPETEGKSLEEIEYYYGRRRSLGTVLANVATLSEAPVLVGIKPAPSQVETSLSLETLTTSVDTIATPDGKQGSNSIETLADSVATTDSKQAMASHSVETLADSVATPDTSRTDVSLSAPSLVEDVEPPSLSQGETSKSAETVNTPDTQHYKSSLSVELVTDKADHSDSKKTPEDQKTTHANYNNNS